MNCKPDDLATIIWCDLPECRANVGAIVKVVRWVNDEIQWLVETQGRPLLGMRADGSVVERAQLCAYDSSLRPIRGEPERESIPTHK